LFLWVRKKRPHTSIAQIQTVLPVAIIPGVSAGRTPGLIDEDEVARMPLVGLLTEGQMVEAAPGLLTALFIECKLDQMHSIQWLVVAIGDGAKRQRLTGRCRREERRERKARVDFRKADDSAETLVVVDRARRAFKWPGWGVSADVGGTEEGADAIFLDERASEGYRIGGRQRMMTYRERGERGV
jgi:hypothetical protein